MRKKFDPTVCKFLQYLQERYYHNREFLVIERTKNKYRVTKKGRLVINELKRRTACKLEGM